MEPPFAASIAHTLRWHRFFILNRRIGPIPNQDAATGYALIQGVKGGRVVVGNGIWCACTKG